MSTTQRHDEQTTIAYCSVPSPGHDFPDHPENASRVPAIMDALEEAQLLSDMTELKCAAAKIAQVQTCHLAEYIEALELYGMRGDGYIDDAPTYVTTASFDAALHSAGAAIAAADAVMDARAPAALSLSRPPGHHAIPTDAMGFCLLNNAAIAARHAQGRGLERVMIVDFDVHHGNGTQDIFYTDDSVYYASIHQDGIYPGTGSEGETGFGDGEGANLNVPLPAGAGDQAMHAALEGLVLPAAERFEPQLLIVSAGFDAHFRDMISQMQCTGPGYCAATKVLTDLPALGNGLVNVVRALRGEEPDDSLGGAPHEEPDVGELIERVRARHDLPA
jgi:acetoin utilization deacetylase AcuC-like enzyme